VFVLLFFYLAQEKKLTFSNERLQIEEQLCEVCKKVEKYFSWKKKKEK